MTKRKTTPHLKRGPKLKPRPPKRKVGRPETPLSAQPYRIALAIYEALVAMGLSRRKAVVWLEAMYKGPITTTVEESSIVLSIVQPKGIDLEDFAKDCECLRSLARWHAAKPDDLAWLRSMSEAIAAGPWRPDASDIVLDLAARANETEWARQVLLPILLEGQPAEPAVPELVG